MKNKALIACLITATILLVPFSTIAEEPTTLKDAISEENTVDTIEITNEEIMEIFRNAVEEESMNYGIISGLQLKEIIINGNLVIVLDGDTYIGICAIFLILIIFYAARFIGKSMDAIRDIIDEEGLLAFLDAAMASRYGGTAMIFAYLFLVICIPAQTVGENQDLTTISGGCGCIPNNDMGDLILQETISK